MIDAIVESTSSLTILAPDFTYTGANDYDEQFTISEVDGVLQDGEYTQVRFLPLAATSFKLVLNQTVVCRAAELD